MGLLLGGDDALCVGLQEVGIEEHLPSPVQPFLLLQDERRFLGVADIHDNIHLLHYKLDAQAARRDAAEVGFGVGSGGQSDGIVLFQIYSKYKDY